MALKRVLIGIAVLVLVLAIYKYHAEEKGQAVKRLFPSASTSVELVSYGQERSIFGDGHYVLILKVSEPEFQMLLERESYRVQRIEANSTEDDLDLCNSILNRLGKVNFIITPAFDSYRKETRQNRTRLFYDKTQHLAVVVGFGKFAN